MRSRPKVRQVLECASPLALSIGSRPLPKRQRTGALQNATARFEGSEMHRAGFGPVPAPTLSPGGEGQARGIMKAANIGVIGIVAAMTAAAALAHSAVESGTYTNPVFAGDYPDPSLIRLGKDYWATATSSEWGPQFPILSSPDLVNWKIVGAIFPKRPAWAVGNFWAPEISEYQGRYFVYYVGRKKDGPLSVAVASADKPEGPYTDHGPLVSQDAGSIDPMAVTDEKGERCLVWKEDGNSRKLPTVIWAQTLSDDGASLVGERKELIRNDAPWEGAVVEGPFVLRRGERFYLFYSGSGCCGRGCAYAMGVARSRSLFGPWEKNPANSILAGNEHWRCPGHGSIVTDDRGRYFLLYHAYEDKTFVFTGRQMLLDEVKFGGDDWPTINGGQGPSTGAPSPFGITQTGTAVAAGERAIGPPRPREWRPTRAGPGGRAHQRSDRRRPGAVNDLGRLPGDDGDRHARFEAGRLRRSVGVWRSGECAGGGGGRRQGHPVAAREESKQNRCRIGRCHLAERLSAPDGRGRQSLPVRGESGWKRVESGRRNRRRRLSAAVGSQRARGAHCWRRGRRGRTIQFVSGHASPRWGNDEARVKSETRLTYDETRKKSE